MRLVALLALAASAGFAANWSGVLVDSGCYASEQRNTNKDQSTVDRDMNLELRLCAARTTTKSFAVVLPDWHSVRLDAAGNAKAAALVQANGHAKPMEVTVTGQRSGDTIQVGAITHR